MTSGQNSFLLIYDVLVLIICKHKANEVVKILQLMENDAVEDLSNGQHGCRLTLTFAK